ncbi:putative bifunctional diguanylate cyclase/phosphodiesterase [Pelagerythrobacter marinus]|uniref:putative bifunctional diguanylate cyclase/phosphodiesterase n=1 Tax=Pelagerythrobacter marinus TaxID=538382 RepID=UPI00203767C3|nr:bifunctional diguanylate cyclase/phosphodiesterase [Pelagerythrobacter marinus]USA39814.1 bifunctional diguanylate cyclase/phosphodiesterase [Pelagerythrobacter marinus]WPZ06055.1 bifunctional diguanylate cyclase/phosphodiesterase [Pelagerythrobacter marinus]
MTLEAEQHGFAPRLLVIVPLVVLTAIYAAICLALLLGDDYGFARTSHLILGGSAIYAIAVLLLLRFGFAHVARLERLGITDSLSQLPNRRALHRNIASGSGPNQEIAVALIDLDGFKTINDLYGHGMGDQLIKEVAANLRQLCGEDAVAYRLGGDEFAISLIGPLAGTLLEGICRGFLETLTHPVGVAGKKIPVGASVGLARCTAGEPLDSSELLRRADVAMYVSKRDGKMRCTWFKPEFDHSLEALRDLDNELRAGLLNNEFEVHYQPLVDARTHEIVAVEALLRWARPDGREIGPDVFVPVAEESGLINSIGQWVLRRACTDALSWDIQLSVNISAAQLRNPEFPFQLGQILEETGLPPERLELEITETCLVLDPVVAERTLDLVRGLGVDVVLDDFGTGYASIGFLRQFRFEKLKLDRSLVVDAASDESSRAMMLSSISMARALAMRVTAEGVETEDQATMVRSAGCDHLQGWLYFAPMPARDIAPHLSRPASANGARKRPGRKVA